jgi:peroxin-11B
LHTTGTVRFGDTSIMIINMTAPRFWAIGLSASALLAAYKLHNWHQQHSSKKENGSCVWKDIYKDKVARHLSLSLIQDVVDLVIPLSAMGAIDVSSGTVGLAGTITSLLGAYSLLHPT